MFESNPVVGVDGEFQAQYLTLTRSSFKCFYLLEQTVPSLKYMNFASKLLCLKRFYVSKFQTFYIQNHVYQSH